MTTAKENLANYIKQNGPVPTVRVSSAQAHGRARKYPYWGAVRYQIGLSLDGVPRHIPLERASSDRRSRRLARYDAEKLAAREGRIVVDFRIGKLSEEECEYILKMVQHLSHKF
jgi:hypothetical protein